MLARTDSIQQDCDDGLGALAPPFLYRPVVVDEVVAAAGSVSVDGGLKKRK